jgi:MFS family permease
MGAVYGSSVGMQPGRLSLFLLAPMVGALLFQWPIGWLSDKLPRRAVLFGVSVAAALTPLVALAVPALSPLALVAMVLLGGSLFPFYSLTIAHTNDWLEAKEILSASGTLVRINGTGAVTGPLLAGSLMSAFGPRLFFWSLSAIFCAAAVFILGRIVSKDPLPRERQRRYAPMPVRALSGATNLIPRRRRNDAGIPSGRMVNK